MNSWSKALQYSLATERYRTVRSARRARENNQDIDGIRWAKRKLPFRLALSSGAKRRDAISKREKPKHEVEEPALRLPKGSRRMPRLPKALALLYVQSRVLRSGRSVGLFTP
jgi:hypothetical protein